MTDELINILHFLFKSLARKQFIDPRIWLMQSTVARTLLSAFSLHYPFHNPHLVKIDQHCTNKMHQQQGINWPILIKACVFCIILTKVCHLTCQFLIYPAKQINGSARVKWGLINWCDDILIVLDL